MIYYKDNVEEEIENSAAYGGIHMLHRHTSTGGIHMLHRHTSTGGIHMLHRHTVRVLEVSICYIDILYEYWRYPYVT